MFCSPEGRVEEGWPLGCNPPKEIRVPWMLPENKNSNLTFQRAESVIQGNVAAMVRLSVSLC